MLEKLGNGTFGHVYKVVDTCTQSALAFKQVESGTADQGMHFWLLREMSLMKALSGHANILHLENVLFVQDHVFLVLELMDMSLGAYMARLRKMGAERMEAGQVQSLMRQLLCGLEHCHGKLILHRDIKPQNLLVNGDGSQLKISDFGSSRPLLSTLRDDGYSGVCIVSAMYRPPEIFLGDTKYGTAVDMWSAGCVLGEMMNGGMRPLMECSTEFEILMRMFQTFGTPTEETWPGVSALPSFSTDFPACGGEGGVERLLTMAPTDGKMGGLLQRLVVFHPKDRISAKQALLSYFAR